MPPLWIETIRLGGIKRKKTRGVRCGKEGAMKAFNSVSKYEDIMEHPRHVSNTRVDLPTSQSTHFD